MPFTVPVKETARPVPVLGTKNLTGQPHSTKKNFLRTIKLSHSLGERFLDRIPSTSDNEVRFPELYLLVLPVLSSGPEQDADLMEIGSSGTATESACPSSPTKWTNVPHSGIPVLASPSWLRRISWHRAAFKLSTSSPPPPL